MKTAQEILDKVYAPRMHWHTVNREKVLSAMEQYAQQKATAEAEKALVLKEALERAIEVIKGWHNMGFPSGRLTKEQIDLAWKIYYERAPEMKPIREALTQYNQP